jgi:hypothetical protein
MNALEDKATDEHRRERRMRTLKRGRIVFNGGFASFECTVKDLSAGGARLQFGDALGVPQHFDLLIESDHMRKPCTVRWRRDNLLGVSFDD